MSRGQKRRTYLLAGGAALVALAAGAALTVDLGDGAPAARDAPATRESKPTPRPTLANAPPPRANEKTVYDAQDDLEECARTDRTLDAASTAPGLDDDIRTISDRLERIRGLEFEARVETRLLPRDEVGERFVRGYLRRFSPSEAARATRVLTALRLVPEGVDLREAGARLFGEGVAGFYGSRARRLVAATSEDGLGPFDEVVLAHELDHALVDQRLGLPRTSSKDPERDDATLARQALAEGDATLAMSRYAYARLGAAATTGFLTRFSGAPVTPLPGIPYVLVRTSEFPYLEGLLLVCTVWRRGGWDAVDDMYERPPVSTAQVLFPARYRAGVEPETPARSPGPGSGWKRVLTASFGAFDLMLLLESADVARAGEVRPGIHAGDVRGWAGGALHAWARGPATAVHVALVDAGIATASRTHRRLCGVLRGWLTDTFPEAAARGRVWTTSDGAAGLACERADVRLALAPSKDVVRRLLGT